MRRERGAGPPSLAKRATARSRRSAFGAEAESREQGVRHDEPVTSALQSYADRGVFRGFRATPGTRGRIEHQFLWLTRRPMTAVLDPRRKTLTFPSLLPGIDRSTAAELSAIVKARTGREVPAHKRVDSRRARLSSALRKGAFSVAIEIRGQNQAYAVRHALNVINEMFLMLHERHPEYLIEHFGISTE